MDLYHIWCDLGRGVSDLDFVSNVDDYLAKLKSDGLITDFRVARRKLGLGPPRRIGTPERSLGGEPRLRRCSPPARRS